MDTTLPADFPQSGIDQFDRLRAEGLLHYYPGPAEVVTHNGFHFEFRISQSIARKPVLAADAPERRGRGGPFVDPDPAFVVARPGPEHVLELSMHAMLRPHYVLHTRLFAPQTDDLDAGDWAAAWAVMRRMADDDSDSTNPMMIYNGGFDAGASQGHKHMQVFVQPDPGFALFPAAAPSADAIFDRHPHVPFQHFALRLRGDLGPTPADLQATYAQLRAAVAAAHAAHRRAHPEEYSGIDAEAPSPYNVIVSRQWMCLIPRRRGGRAGTGAGSLGMLGLLWLKNEQERAHWTELGMTDHLVWMGLPREDSKQEIA